MLSFKTIGTQCKEPANFLVVLKKVSSLRASSIAERLISVIALIGAASLGAKSYF